MGILIGHTDEGERGTLLTALEVLHGGELHRLVLCHLIGGEVTGGDGEDRGDDAEGGGELDALESKAIALILEQVVAANTHGDDSTEEPAGDDGVEELCHSHGIERHGGEVDHLIADGVRIEVHAGRILHPAIGDEDPPGGDGGTEDRHPGGEVVEAVGDLAPAEEHHHEERRLQEEGYDTLDGERRTEDVADEVGVIGPIGTELKLEDKTGSDTDGKVDPEDLLPKLGRLAPEVLLRPEILRLSDCHHQAHAQRQRDKEPVVHRRHGKHDPRPVNK